MTTTTDTQAATATAPATRLDKQLAAHRVQGDLMPAIPTNIRIVSWTITSEGLRGQMQVWPTDDHQSRLNLRNLADLFDLAYRETAAKAGDGHAEVSASGVVDGVAVKFWDFVAPCTCGCHAAGATS